VHEPGRGGGLAAFGRDQRRAGRGKVVPPGFGAVGQPPAEPADRAEAGQGGEALLGGAQ
jgi:hypothetical protein